MTTGRINQVTAFRETRASPVRARHALRSHPQMRRNCYVRLLQAKMCTEPEPSCGTGPMLTPCPDALLTISPSSTPTTRKLWERRRRASQATTRAASERRHCPQAFRRQSFRASKRTTRLRSPFGESESRTGLAPHLG